MHEQARLLLQLLFSHIFLPFRKMTKEDIHLLQEIFGKAAAIPTLSKGILFFLHHFVRSGSVLGDDDDKKVVIWGCRVAKEVLQSQSTAEALF